LVDFGDQVMSAGAGGAAAAAAEQRRMRHEEEEMTGYTAGDISQDWEFKIIRSAMGGFRSTDFLRRVLEEEAVAGWTLLEKFDNSRVRLKRPARARELDGKLNIDPYRTHVGMSDVHIALIIVGFALTFVLGLILFAANH
jgi:hypothetical protein